MAGPIWFVCRLDSTDVQQSNMAMIAAQSDPVGR